METKKHYRECPLVYDTDGKPIDVRPKLTEQQIEEAHQGQVAHFNKWLKAHNKKNKR